MPYGHSHLIHIFFAVALAVFPKGRSLSQTARPDRVVVVPVANMYSAATEDSDVVSPAIVGGNVVALGAHGNWARARPDDQYKGWMLSDTRRKLGESGADSRSGQVVPPQLRGCLFCMTFEILSHFLDLWNWFTRLP